MTALLFPQEDHIQAALPRRGCSLTWPARVGGLEEAAQWRAPPASSVRPWTCKASPGSSGVGEGELSVKPNLS